MLLEDGTPVIALTLRWDRLDNFWFCLCHELGHIVRLLGRNEGCRFFDNLDVEGDSVEAEADDFAEKALIPSGSWEKSCVRDRFSTERVREFANQLKIHPAIVAGRIRRERRDYRILWPLVGNREVRGQFPDFKKGSV